LGGDSYDQRPAVDRQQGPPLFFSVVGRKNSNGRHSKSFRSGLIVIAYGWLLVAAFFHSSSSLDGRSHIIKRWGLCGLLGCPHINVLMIYDWARQQKDIKQAEQKISSFCFIPIFFLCWPLYQTKKGCNREIRVFLPSSIDIRST
jgi:hypothetical protein